jgi:hypothetical protein
MLIFFTAFLLIGLFSFSLLGWGVFFKNITDSSSSHDNNTITIILGLALWVFIGGILNVLSLAYPFVLDSILIVGLIIFLLKIKTLLPEFPREREKQAYALTLFTLISVIMGFVITTQLPPDAYNFHDDYEKYFAHPHRMLQTGTLFGSPLSAIGLETMGGQAFLHGFILTHFSVEMLNGLDSVFSLFLCLILVGSIGWIHPRSGIISLLSVSLVFLIHPQYVNISALYSASAFIIAIVLYMSQYHQPIVKLYSLPNPSGIALLYASLFAIKMTFIPFATLHFLITILGMIIITRNYRASLEWGFKVSIWGGLFISPWIILHAQNYLKIIGANEKQGLHEVLKENIDLLSTNSLFFGATYSHYTLIAVGMFLIGIYMFYQINKNKTFNSQIACITIFSASVSGSLLYFLFILMGPLQGGYDQGLRYSIPVLIGLTAVILPTFTLYIMNEDIKKQNQSHQTVSIIIALVLMISFIPIAKNRVKQAMSSGSILSFSEFASSKEYLKYNNEVLYGDTKNRIKRIQDIIPPNTKVITWISTPFYLDYARNIIIDIDTAGLQSPWATVTNANYVMWEYDGYATRTRKIYIEEAQRTGKMVVAKAYTSYKFTTFLSELSKKGDIIYNDGEIAVFQISANTVFNP